jgi:protein required for attachment to host cells
MMAKFITTWVLVADSARARIFKWSDSQGPLEELDDLINPVGRLKEGELAAERPGVAFSSKGHQSGHPMQATSLTDAAADEFARALADALKGGLDQHECERLVIAAPPEFLGLLRSRLDRRTEKAVAASIDRDLTRESAEAILSRLPNLTNLAGE